MATRAVLRTDVTSSSCWPALLRSPERLAAARLRAFVSSLLYALLPIAACILIGFAANLSRHQYLRSRNHSYVAFLCLWFDAYFPTHWPVFSFILPLIPALSSFLTFLILGLGNYWNKRRRVDLHLKFGYRNGKAPCRDLLHRHIHRRNFICWSCCANRSWITSNNSPVLKPSLILYCRYALHLSFTANHYSILRLPSSKGILLARHLTVFNRCCCCAFSWDWKPFTVASGCSIPTGSSVVNSISFSNVTHWLEP